MNYKNAYITLEDNSGYKYHHPANVTIGIDGRIIAESYRPLDIKYITDKHSYEDCPCIFALKSDIEKILNFISEAQDRGDINIEDNSKVDFAFLRLQDMLDGIIYPKFIETLRHNYPLYINDLNRKIKREDDEAVKLLGNTEFYMEYPNINKSDKSKDIQDIPEPEEDWDH